MTKEAQIAGPGEFIRWGFALAEADTKWFDSHSGQQLLRAREIPGRLSR